MTTRQLFGVGVGPGDPELVTIKAVRILAEAGLVLVPVMAGGGPAEPGRAEATVRAHIEPARIRRVPFALSDRGGVTRGRLAAWDAAARQVAAAFAAGVSTVAFATIGDPNIYSTFSYLAQTVRELVPDVVVRTVPGITAMQDLAARSGTVLAEGIESLVLLPLSRDAGSDPATGSGARSEGATAGSGGPESATAGGAGPDAATGSGGGPAADTPLATLREALARHDTVVAYKLGAAASGGRAGLDIPALLATLKEAGRLDEAIYGARLGLLGEDIRPASELAGTTALPYLSTLIAPGRRSGAGSKLR
ncbi:MAG TPA: precorrin-2 C(20)-methyltransferase [Streptosporangiaceae bacterium]|nr:precorrin-2 C(20)-methyltransferase [Streptosporangiaceae bacterium]